MFLKILGNWSEIYTNQVLGILMSDCGVHKQSCPTWNGILGGTKKDIDLWWREGHTITPNSAQSWRWINLVV